ncbi:hypothetical protein M8009_12850 [Halomonas sp. ATCH28]|uniref:Uncharacterized protein n=1 Tax=Halomonas gemina TaxID=2945105 RepID=A0ABT0T361_9GAMM|nr:hypothetical protein [Halomonas gemina]MCL7941174.1 hypothetical protein [Halomonas gemina]
MTNAIKIDTRFNADEIRQEVRESDSIRGSITEHIMNLRDQGVREALEKLGWTPPGEESVQNQLCVRIDELEREKEVLNSMLDRREELLNNLRPQADALHRIGSILGLAPGSDLTKEAPARVEALAARYAALADEVRALIQDSDGLAGYHLNGEAACWSELEVGHLLDEPDEIGNAALARRDSEVIASLRFPVMLRKMWSGGEVQQWLSERADEKRREAEGGGA